MKRSIVRGTVLAALAGIGVALLLAVLMIYLLYQQSLQERLKSTLILFSAQVEIATASGEDLSENLEQMRLAMAKERQGLRFTIIDPEGTIVAESHSFAGGAGDSRLDRPEVIEALEGGWGFDLRKSDTSPTSYLYAAYADDGYIYRAALPAADYGDFIHWLLLGSILCLVIGSVTAILLSRRMAERLTAPVRSLTKATDAIARGSFDQRVGDYPAELGELGKSFNEMAEQLDRMASRLQAQNDELHSILDGIQDGIIALRGENLEPFLLTDQVVGMLGDYSKRYGSLASYGQNYAKLETIAKEALLSGEPVLTRIEPSNTEASILTVYAGRYGDQNEPSVVIVLHDNTRVSKLERMRTEFVANVTHELKTPLTSIRGYVQLLQSAERDSETRASFYEIIEIETERLMNLIGDLLDLAEIENRVAGPDEASASKPSCSLYELAREVRDQVEPLAATREVSLHIEMPETLEFAADHRRMKQLLSNLVTNAVIYNRPGGEVRVRAGIERDMLSIWVMDNGLGIPEEDQERIFERFYRLSKDRSRELGGTGLGLSIVKHIVNLYGGRIDLASVVDKGSVFHIRFPLSAGQD